MRSGGRTRHRGWWRALRPADDGGAAFAAFAAAICSISNTVDILLGGRCAKIAAQTANRGLAYLAALKPPVLKGFQLGEGSLSD